MKYKGDGSGVFLHDCLFTESTQNRRLRGNAIGHFMTVTNYESRSHVWEMEERDKNVQSLGSTEND